MGINSFVMNGYLWRVVFVDPTSNLLVDRTGTRTVAVTDPNTLTIYLSCDLTGTFLVRVLIHELGHCALFSFHLLDDIHRMARPENWIEAEEWTCNFIADYGRKIFSAAYAVLGDDAWIFIPYELEQMIS